MSDFKVQYCQGTIASASTTRTLTAAGGDFEAVSNLNRAFILPATTMPTVGLGAEGGTSQVRSWAASARFTAVDTIELARGSAADAQTCGYAFWIIEYTGAAGGHNEFIVRDRGEATFPDAILTFDSAAIAGIANLSKCVPFINGRFSAAGNTSIREFLAEARVYNNGTNDVVGFERRLMTNGDPTYAYQVVEFVGDWWLIQQGVTTNFTAETDKDTLISALLGLNKAWIHGYFNPANASGPQAATWYAWMATLTTLRARTPLTGSATRFRWFVLMNIDPSFSVETINEVDGAANWTGGDGSTAQFEGVNITRPRPGSTFVQGRAGSSETLQSSNPAALWRFRQNADDNVEARRLKNLGTSEYLVQVVQLPGDSLPPPLRHQHNTLLRM